MARIRQFIHGNQDVRLHPTEVDCRYQTIQGPAGAVLHLTTFGSEERNSAPKSSQSFQLDERAAGAVLELLLTTYPSLRGRA